MNAEQKHTLERAILADLSDQSLTYLVIAYRHQVGTNRVQELAKLHNLTRKRGRKLGSTATRPVQE
jgi:hypothetical protein